MKKIQTLLALFSAAAVPLAYYMTQRQQSARGRLQSVGDTAAGQAGDIAGGARDVLTSWGGSALGALGSLGESGQDALGSLGGATRDRAGSVASAAGSAGSKVRGVAAPVLSGAPRVVARLRRTQDSDNPYGGGSDDWRNYGEAFPN